MAKSVTGEALFVHGDPLMIDHTPSADVAVGDVVPLGERVLIAHSAIAANELGALAAGDGVYDGVKTAGGAVTFTAGDPVWWDDTNDVFEPAATGDLFAGYAIADAADADTTVRFVHARAVTAASV